MLGHTIQLQSCIVRSGKKKRMTKAAVSTGTTALATHLVGARRRSFLIAGCRRSTASRRYTAAKSGISALLEVGERPGERVHHVLGDVPVAQVAGDSDSAAHLLQVLAAVWARRQMAIGRLLEGDGQRPLEVVGHHSTHCWQIISEGRRRSPRKSLMRTLPGRLRVRRAPGCGPGGAGPVGSPR